MLKIVLKFILWGAVFIPWGVFSAIASPSPHIPFYLWLFYGGFCSFILVETVIIVSFFIPLSPFKQLVFERKRVSFGLVSIVAGALLPSLIICFAINSTPLNFQSLSLWSILIIVASIISTIIVFVFDYMSYSRFTFYETGFIVDSFSLRRFVLYDEVVWGLSSKGISTIIVLKNGGNIHLDGHLTCRRKKITIGHILFAPFLNSLRPFKHLDGRAVMIRFMSAKAYNCRKFYNSSASFFVDALGNKSSLISLSVLASMVPVIFSSIFFLFVIFDRLRLIDSVNIVSAFNNFPGHFSLTLITVASILAARFYLLGERRRMFLLQSTTKNFKWAKQSISFINKMTFVSLTFVVILLFFVISQLDLLDFASLFNTALWVLMSALGILCLLGGGSFYFYFEKKVNRALVSGTPDVALPLIEQYVKNPRSKILSARRAYALAVNGLEPDLSLSLARQSLCTLITDETILYATLSGARVLQLQNDISGAKQIARKILLRYAPDYSLPSTCKSSQSSLGNSEDSDAFTGDGIKNRLLFEAQSIQNFDSLTASDH